LMNPAVFADNLGKKSCFLSLIYMSFCSCAPI
jgi:hypothetical protein